MQCLHPIDVVGGGDTTARSFSLQYRVARLISEDINSKLQCVFTNLDRVVRIYTTLLVNLVAMTD